MITDNLKKPFYHRLAMVMIIIIALGYLVIIGKEVLCPLVFGILFSILLLPLANFIEKKCKIKRAGAAGIAVIIMVICFVGLIYLVSSQIIRLTQDLPKLQEQLTNSFAHIQSWISNTFNVNIKDQNTILDTTTKSLKKSTPSLIGSTVISVSSMLLFFVFIMLDTFFIIAYRKMLLQFLIDVFLEHNAKTILDIIGNVQNTIRNYVIGLFMEMLTVAAVCFVVFFLFGIKFAILLALITAILNIVPYIGIFSALVLNAFIVFTTAASASKVLVIVITIVSMHLIDSNILLPLIVGSKVRINAFITILGVVVGQMIWGFSGMFLSIPVIAIAKIIFDRVEHLKPWGLLLGYENFQKKPIKIKYTLKNKRFK